jgi:phage tail tape-measure protein
MVENEADKKPTENEKTAGLAGAGAGVVAGAQLGSIIIPIPIVGTFTGALVGGIVGSKIGKKVGASFMDHLGAGKSSDKGKVDVTAELQRLATLHAQGVITDEEFKAAKAKLLGL